MSDLNRKLDEDFLYILEFSKHEFNNFSKTPIQNSLCNQWLTKLSSGTYEGMNAKRTRNSYLTKLIVCMFRGKLTDMFLQQPPEGDLKSIPMPHIIEAEPYWLNDIIGSGKAIDGVQGCQTYMSTELLDNNRGICAYLAMNVVDEGDPDTHWMNLGDGMKFEQRIEDIFDNDERLNLEKLIRNESMKTVTEENVYFEHRNFLIKSILNELEGKTKEGESSDFEEGLQAYLTEIRGTEEEDIYKNLSPKKKRRLLLSNTKSVLISEILNAVAQ